MKKKNLSKDERIRRQTFAIKVCLTCIIILFLFIAVQSFFGKRAVLHAGMNGIMFGMTEEEFCFERHGRNLTADGYCDITSIDYDGALWRDTLATEEFLYEHYVDCSWGKMLVKNFNPEGNSLNDRLRYWYVKCQFNQTKKVIIDGENNG